MKQRVYHRKHGFGIQHHNGLPVIRVNKVVLFQYTFYVGLSVCDSVARFHGDTHHSNVIAYVVGSGKGGERYADGFVGIAIQLNVVVGFFRHADDLIVDSIRPDKLTA